MELPKATTRMAFRWVLASEARAIPPTKGERRLNANVNPNAANLKELLTSHTSRDVIRAP